MSEAVDEYLHFSQLINSELALMMLDSEMNSENYNRQVVWAQILQRGVQIRGYRFPGKSRGVISGMIVKDELETTLTYNMSMPINHQNFTISHEMTHFLHHMKSGTGMFSDTKDCLEYSPVEMIQEFQANIGASAILIPDAVLIAELKKGTAPVHLSKRYGISEAALYMRLAQTMHTHIGSSWDLSRKSASRMVNTNATGSLRTLGHNWEKIAIYADPFYELLAI